MISIQEIVTSLARLKRALVGVLFCREHRLCFAVGIIHHCSIK